MYGRDLMDDNKVAVLLEQLMSQFRTFGEGLDGLKDEMNTRFNNLDQRFNSLEYKLDSHIIENRQEYQQLMQAVKELDTEVVKLKRVK